MAAPTKKVRETVLARDGHQCVSCPNAAGYRLEMQHRQAVGNGGSKVRPEPHELATSCAICNARYEADMQDVALARGWKVRGWVRAPGLVPMYRSADRVWLLLTSAGTRVPITEAHAIKRMHDVYGDQWDEWARAAGINTEGTKEGWL